MRPVLAQVLLSVARVLLRDHPGIALDERGYFGPYDVWIYCGAAPNDVCGPQIYARHLARSPTGRPGEFWTITDRGPNGQIKVGKDKRRTFPAPDFDPMIVKVRAVHGVLTTRLLRFSTRTLQVTAEYAFQFSPVDVVDPGEDDPAELKVSSVVGIGPNTVLVQERTDQASRISVVDLRRATNLLGGPYDDPATSRRWSSFLTHPRPASWWHRRYCCLI